MKVSILIPCRNEEKFIAECLESVLAQDYSDKEILLVDGMSTDKTREIAGKYKEVKILNNEKKITSSALNIGIKNAAGEIIIRMDAHAKYEKNYVSKCVYYLNKYKADNVGGTIKTLASKNTIIAKAIAKSLSSFFGAGSSLFRTGTKECVWVHPVFGGCFKKGLFDKIGYFNENLIRSQDMEFNLRLKRFGGKILLTPDIISYYYTRSTINLAFIYYYFRYSCEEYYGIISELLRNFIFRNYSFWNYSGIITEFFFSGIIPEFYHSGIIPELLF